MKAIGWALLVLSVVGCTPVEIPLDPPDDWLTDGGERWWTATADTSKAFRDLSSLESMGIQTGNVIYDASQPLARQTRVGGERMTWAVKNALLPLYRNSPEVVDSLFDRYVTPSIMEGRPINNPLDAVERLKRESYRKLARHFREPRPLLQLGRDIPVDLPDSLRGRVGGLVRFQVYVSDEGEPIAVLQQSHVHPVLDRLALLATLKMRWQPAYLLTGSKSRPRPAWVRFRVRFAVQPAKDQAEIDD